MKRPDGSLALAGLAAGGLGLVLAGCAADQTTEGPATGVSTAAVTPEVASRAEAVEQRYVVGPAAAREIGYRVDWQHPATGAPITRVVVEDDSVFILDTRNFLTRFRRESGDRLWRVPAARPVEEILGVTYIPSAERVFVNVGGALLEYEATTGAQVGRQKLEKIASTEPVVRNQFLIYGTRNGQIVWRSYVLGTGWRGYQISHYIQIAPLLVEDYVVAVGNDGRIMVLRADTAQQVWSRKLLAPVVAPPTAGNGGVYVSSLDQHVRGYDLREARTALWEYLTESPLTESPVLVDDHVYQQVPSEGLVCLEALPLDSPGGVVRWRAEEATGTVLTRLGPDLLAWDGAARRLDLVDVRLGAVVKSIDLPQARTLRASDVAEGDLYATGDEGRIVRLVPRR